MSRILLTGEGGMLAREIALALQANGGHEIVKIEDPALLRQVAKFHRRQEVDCASNNFPEAVAKVRPDIIVHCAALVNTDKCDEDPALCLEANLMTTIRCLEAAKLSGAKLVYISTTASYDYRSFMPRPFHEGSPQRPPTLYGITKYAGEMLVTGQSQVPWLIIRPCFIFGDPPYDFSSAMARVAVHSALKVLWPEKAGPTPKVLLDPNNFKDYTRIENFAEGAALAINHGPWGTMDAIYNISAERAQKTSNFYDALQGALGVPLDVEWVPELDYMGDHVVSASRLRMATGWVPRISITAGAALLADRTREYIARCKSGAEELLYK